MSNDQLHQWLNLVHSSPKFVIKIDQKAGKGTVQSPQIVPTNDGGYWRVGQEWLDMGDERSYSALASTRDKETLFDWTYAVPLTEDIYHR